MKDIFRKNKWVHEKKSEYQGKITVITKRVYSFIRPLRVHILKPLHSGMGGLVGILVGFELRVSGHLLKPTEYKSIVLCSKSYIFMVKN